LGHLGLIVSDAAYAIITPTGDNGSIIWTNPTTPGRAPIVLDQGTAAQFSAVRHSWDESLLTYRTFNAVQQALKKQIITVFETMYLDIFIEDMVGFANITAQEMIDHLFLTYGNITAVALEKKIEQMRKAWDPQKPVETLFKQIQDCADFLFLGGSRSTYWPSAANRCGICQYFCHMQLHERLPQMEREGHCGKDMDKLQGTLCRSSSAAQADAGGVTSQFRLSCSKCRCWSN
jgi:hypothetical protein